MAQYPTTFESDFEPLTRGDLTGIGRSAIESLARHGFVAGLGLRETDIREPGNVEGDLSRMTGEPEIIEYCPSDRGRFGNVEAGTRWLSRTGGRGFIGIYATLKEGLLCDPDITQFERDDVQMVAYGWSGPRCNEYIKGADITTAFRVGERGQILAADRRRGPERFSLGRMVGQLVIATAIEKFGAEPEQLSLETWQSNRRATKLYHVLGFRRPADVPPIRAERPTVIHEVGDEVDGNVVYLDEDRRMVTDYRLHMRYDPDGRLAAA